MSLLSGGLPGAQLGIGRLVDETAATYRDRVLEGGNRENSVLEGANERKSHVGGA